MMRDKAAKAILMLESIIAMENLLPVFQTFLRRIVTMQKIRMHQDSFVTLQQIKSRMCVSFRHHVSNDEMEDKCDKITQYYETQFECLLSFLSDLKEKHFW